LLLLPRTTAEVAAIVGWCADHGVAITPQGGNTGLVGGQIPDGEVLVSLEKMRAVRDVSPLDDVMVVEAGLPLAEAQGIAAAAGRFFPLSLASEGTATIGGLISTNAGGVAVLRYGVMRDLVLGLEAVLPNGAVFQGLKRLRKDNTGYDLKQLLIGAEGTLGIVTAATLKLFPHLTSRATALVGLASPKAALDLLARAKADSGGGVEAFELISALGVSFAERHVPGVRSPLGHGHAWQVLIELASAEAGHAEVALARLLEAALAAGAIDCGKASRRPRSRKGWPGSTTLLCPLPWFRSSSNRPPRRSRRFHRGCASVPSGMWVTATSIMIFCNPWAVLRRTIWRGGMPGPGSCTTLP
jgi:FAD/FMN-containing dehydrogenase